MENQTISGRYRILQKLGTGGFSQTFLAEDLHLPTKPRCVVKHLKPQLKDAESIALANRLFEQEAEVLYRLGNHPNIPQILAHFEEAGEFYLVQELIEGYTLAQELAGAKILAEVETVKIIGQVLETLAFVHGQNVIHRDIKPANLIRRQADGRIFLIDFGAVKQVGATVANENTNYQSTVTIGSQGFMPSEQMAGKPRFASDLYAVGLVAIEVLTGIHPLKLKQNQNTGEFVWQHKLQLQPEVENFITKLVRYDFRQRFTSAKEASAVLNLIATNMGIFKKNQPVAPVVQVPPSVAPEVFMPQTVFKPSITTPIPNLPPTIISPPTRYFQPTRQAATKKGFFNWLWNNDFALAAFVAVLVLGTFFVGGYALISAVSKSQASKINNTEKFVPDNPNQIFDRRTIGVFEEAITQAQEAEEKEEKAATKNEWREIGNQYQRAYTLLTAVEPTSDNYKAAQERIIIFKQNSEHAFQQASVAPETKALSKSTTTTTTASPTSTANPTSAPSKLAMPSPQSYRTYLSYSFQNYNGVENKVITTNEANFISAVEKPFDSKGDSGVVKVKIDGGSYKLNLSMTAPNGQRLGAGSYPNAQESAWQTPMMYAVSFDKIRCYENARHSFTVKSIVYDKVGASVDFLDATFTMSCGTNKLMGRIRYDARN